MIEFARRHAEFLGAEIVAEVIVPGVYELPLAVKKLVQRDDIDAVVTLGAVIEGETEHDEIVMQHAARKLIDLSVEHGKPVTLGISGPGMTRLQALERVTDYARRSVEAAVKMVRRLEKV
ncbi:MAG: 6,7-dimethyl-8-ribityllumazine synthase [Candidatus Hadarchaeum yellowstonense]|uniref:6,7-dimethyl-8-ribityllumazine synthase n=1 Tax=Hadarchaeum yellowstonense TaxID=1776334 RepID=A0A147JWX9_HADYE|nr:MAG: 6,7-dimethyl-8-ribityllumazine synthase [Candidatus Hadarchaeum yellowstonense]